jgi:hypothetical protein
MLPGIGRAHVGVGVFIRISDENEFVNFTGISAPRPKTLLTAADARDRLSAYRRFMSPARKGDAVK